MTEDLASSRDALSAMPLKYTNKLAGKRVLLVGGTSGIGFATAEATLEHGATIIVASSKQENIDHAVKRLQESYPDQASRVHGLQCDLSSDDTIEATVQKLLQDATSSAIDGGGKLDHIVFTAGNSIRGGFGPLKDVTVSVFHNVGRVRVLGAVMLAKHASPFMVPGVGSSITFTGGSVGVRPAAYGASVVSGFSGFMDGLVRGLAKELRPLRINLVSPGAVHTEHFDNIPADRRAAILKGFGEETCAGEVGKPIDLAEAYLYAMKDNFVTGCVLDNNGGRFLM